ncbi:hypothetical protein N0V90_012313 [Kalmusia sp. IMI 367209]|nr:hypothetical protein N0V90_012313 [Kalmusia sp. IMI 367209]
MSGALWKARRMHETENWQSVWEFLFDILYTFVWLSDDTVQVPMKESFNHIAEEVGTFQSAINARREEKGFQTRVDLRALWLEYIKSVFDTMVARTHAFFLENVKSIVAKAKTEYDAIADEKGDANARDAAKRYGNIWSDLERSLHRADAYIMMPLDGYSGFTPSPSDTKVVGSLFPLPFRWGQQTELSNQKPWPFATRYADDPTALYTDRPTLCKVINESDRNHDHVRLQLRGEPKVLQREPWISIIHSRTQWSLSRGGPQDQKWGFVAYMLTHKPSQEEWEAFLSKLYSDFYKSGEGVQGFEEVKQNMDVQWIHGEDSGIPHDDIEAAKRHFRTFSASPNIRRRVWKMDFLVVDSECFNSYMNPTPFGSIKCAGDYGGFLKLIDTSPYPPNLIRVTAPGYRNEMKVLGSLVFDDLYPQLSGLIQRPRDLWPLAMLHPNQVYVGYPVKGQMKEWGSIWKARVIFWVAFTRWRHGQQT